jgi:peptidoglycan/xylan/chitin deacetylase (PgdA/CDA1 family)
MGECSALVRAAFGPRRGFRILLYHSVGSSLAHDTYGFSIAPALFKEHMTRLSVHPRATLCGLEPGPLEAGGLRVAVTFDDGYKDNLYRAAPVLIEHGVPFTLFATAAFIKSGDPDHLTPAELRELAGLPGVTIGSHGMTHAPLAECDDRTLWEELDGSRRFLEDLIGKPVRTLSYPHGSTSRRVVEAARRAGYLVGACSRSDINGPGRDPLLLCRTEIVAADSPRVFEQKLAGAWDWGRWRRRDPASRW